ncbi:MAG: ABC transporter ATP-binding protein [Acidimicrobiia bacterium]
MSKRFRFGESHDSLRDLVAGRLAGWLRRGRSRGRSGDGPSSHGRSFFWAVKDVGFAVKAGEAFGLIGPNGAGKSTMLKLLAGILRPDGGTVSVRGRLAALIEVGAGFHGDLTGRENIFLNGAILGMTREEVRRKLDAIVAFAGVAAFLDTPVKRYSSGMYARLGFSIAAHVEPEVLLVDEVLSVGDAAFRLRCLGRMRELLSGGTSLVFVTHNLEQMQQICSDALVMEQGRPVFQGPSREAVGHYLEAVSRALPQTPTDLSRGASAVELDHCRLLDAAGERVLRLRPRVPLRAVVTFRLHRAIPRLVVELNLRASPHENLLSFNSGRDGLEFNGRRGVNEVTLHLPAIPLAGGQYFWNIRMWDADRGETILDTPLAVPLLIDDEGRATGIMTVDHRWSLEPAGDTAAMESDDEGERRAGKETISGEGEVVVHEVPVR